MAVTPRNTTAKRLDDKKIQAWLKKPGPQSLQDGDGLFLRRRAGGAFWTLRQINPQTGERTLASNLPSARDEMSCIDLDEPFLRVLAERVGARYVHIDNLDRDAAEIFVPRHQTGVTETVTSVWPRWSVLGVLCLLLSAGWFIRRAIGLV